MSECKDVKSGVARAEWIVGQRYSIIQNPAIQSLKKSESSSFGRAVAFQASGGGFEPRLSLNLWSGVLQDSGGGGSVDTDSSPVSRSNYFFLKSSYQYRYLLFD